MVITNPRSATIDGKVYTARMIREECNVAPGTSYKYLALGKLPEKRERNSETFGETYLYEGERLPVREIARRRGTTLQATYKWIHRHLLGLQVTSERFEARVLTTCLQRVVTCPDGTGATCRSE